MKLKEFHCAKCLERYEVDLNETQCSTQISVIRGKVSENRMYFAKCPNCGEVNTFASNKPEEWGNQKSPNLRKFKFLFGGSCLLVLVISALVMYFAGQGIVTIFEWLGN
ncbi:MAG: redox protein [Lysinibacillus sp.]